MQIYGTRRRLYGSSLVGKDLLQAICLHAENQKFSGLVRPIYTLPDKWSPSVGFLSLFLPFHLTLIPESLVEVLAEAKVEKQLLKHLQYSQTIYKRRSY
jgi:hypothetical protein